MKYALNVVLDQPANITPFVDDLKKTAWPAPITPEIVAGLTIIRLEWSDEDIARYVEFEEFHKTLLNLLDMWENTLDPASVVVLDVVYAQFNDDDPMFFIHGFPHWEIVKHVFVGDE